MPLAMTTPSRSISLPSAFLLAACAFAFAVYSSVPVRGADSSGPVLPKNSFAIDVNKVDEKLLVPDPATSKGSGGSGGKGGKKSNTVAGGAQGGHSVGSQNLDNHVDVTYAITVKNRSGIAVQNLAVEYHFYNVTVNTVNGLTTTTIDDITSTENVDIDPGKSKDVITQAVPKVSTVKDTRTVNPSRGGGRTTPTQTSTTSNLLGWHINVLYNDKIISERHSPDDLKDKIDRINKQNELLAKQNAQ